ncbi:MAG: pilin [Parcubacteria group bacterium]
MLMARTLQPRVLIGGILGLLVAGLVVVAAVSPAYAQQTGPTEKNGLIQCSSSVGQSGTTQSGQDTLPSCDFCQLLKLVNNITFYAVFLLGMVASLMIFISGYLYVTAAGDEQHLSQAKTTLQFAIIGFVIALLSGIIVKTIVVQIFVPEDQRSNAAVFGTIDCKLPEPGAAQGDGGGAESDTGYEDGDTGGGTGGTGTRTCDASKGECTESDELQDFTNCFENNVAAAAAGQESYYGLSTAQIITAVLGQKTTTGGAHDNNSCHFGGEEGCAGGHAVDYGGNGGSPSFSDAESKFVNDAYRTCRDSFASEFPSFMRAEGRNAQGKLCWSPLLTKSNVTHVHIEFGERGFGSCSCPTARAC